MGHVPVDSHLQSFCYPSQAHRRLSSQLLRQTDFSWITLASHAQLLFSPTHPFKFPFQDSLCSGFCRLLDGIPKMVRPSLPIHLSQQFLPELFIAQIPSPLEFLKFALVGSPTGLHPLLKLTPTGGTVPGNAAFARNTLNPKPGRAPLWLL